MIDEGELARIAARAETLDERLARRAAEAGSSEADALLSAWRGALGADEATFRRRLSWDGLTEDDVRSAFSSERPPDARPTRLARGEVASLPGARRPPTPPAGWLDLLELALELAPEVARELASGAPLPELDGLGPGRVPRFAELWIPFVRAARVLLARRASGGAGFAPAASRTLERQLLADLGALGEETLYQLFTLHRDGARASTEGAGPGDGAPARAIYDAFAAGLLDGALPSLFLELSALARLAATLALEHVDASAELARRLDADQGALAGAFGASGGVAEIVSGLSDRHAGGRSVLILGFASGSRVVYKPRPVGLEAAWNAFLVWLGERIPDAPAPIRVLARDGYGWVELVTPAPLASRDEAESYFRKGGALVAAAWALGARDLQMDNVIATRQGPIVIDAEAILQPELALDPRRGPKSAMATANEKLKRSFLSTGLLTSESAAPDGRLLEVGGLRGTGGHSSSAKARVFRHANTDAMTLTEEPTTAAPMPNLPELDGRRLVADELPAAVAAGFDAAYRAILAGKEALGGPGGPLTPFAGEPTRIILRPTDQYARLLAQLSSPKHLREGIFRSFVIDSLTRVLLASRERPPLWPLAADERAALERLDVPAFHVAVDAHALTSSSGERVEGVVTASGLDAFRERLARMSEDDLADQTRLLRAVLMPSLGEPALGAGGDTVPFEAPPRVEESELLRRAAAIGDELLREAIAGEDGSLTWLAPSHLQGASRDDRGVSSYVYDGALGIALFLSALAASTGRPDFRRAALGACRPVAGLLTAPNAAQLLRNEGLGAGNGIGSLVWGLTAIGRVLGEESLSLPLARRAASHVMPERVAKDRLLDVQGGAAGAILGLLALHRATGESDLLAAALACGDHLLQYRRDTGDGVAWPTPDGLALAGMAHGAAGIAFALARLHEATGWDELPPIVEAAARYERGLYDAIRGNWPVLVPGGGRTYMLAWCNGAPGIALARLGMAGQSDAIRSDLMRALQTTRHAGLLPLDHLCCGNVGLVETLLHAGAVLGDAELVARAHDRMGAVLTRSDRAGGFRFRISAEENACFQPGLFRGLSGVGYTLLRLARPGAFPSVLVFEAAG